MSRTVPKAGRWTLLVLVLGAGGFLGYRAWSARGAEGIHYDTVAVDRGRVVARVTASGTLSAIVTVQVSSQISGRLSEIGVDFNSQVKRGQVIAKIDPRLLQAALEQARGNQVVARGNLLKANAQAADADRQCARARNLADRKLLPIADFELAQSAAEVAHAQIIAAEGARAQADAAENLARLNLAFTEIVSPIDGVVISRNVDPGQTVAASLQAPTLFTIAKDLSKMQVDTSVAEADVGKIALSTTATFTVDAYPGVVFQGIVRQIRDAPQTVQNVVTYDAVIDVDNDRHEQRLKPGMTANVTFVTAAQEDVLRIPNAALRFRPPREFLAQTSDAPSGKREAGRAEHLPGAPAAASPKEDPRRRVVWVLRNGRPAEVPIRIGITDGSMTELVEGELHEGDRVITDMSSGSGRDPAAPALVTPTLGGR